jgi:ADP-ribose pyrophosphatase YjhB (NUDIX family)
MSDQLATVIPDSPMPATVSGLPIASWKTAPTKAAGWKQLVEDSKFEEPPMLKVAGKEPASGAVVIEPDGRVWVVSPSNGHGGYTNTFPKGKLDTKDGLSLRQNALKEVFEESGLQVALTGFLCDSVRDTSVTRFYLARRISGNPADMSWESQAVHLVPVMKLAKFASHANDKVVLKTLAASLAC